MKNIDRIINHPLFIMSMKKIHDNEIDRVFCRHGIEHSLDVPEWHILQIWSRILAFRRK